MFVGTGDDIVLRQVAVPIVNWNTCHDLDDAYRHFVTHNMICAGPMQGNKGSCFGDSGGPLVCKQGDRWFQYGTVSFGLDKVCATANHPVVYADVVTLLPWIQQHTGTGSYCRYLRR